MANKDSKTYIGWKSIHENEIGITIRCVLWKFLIGVKTYGSSLQSYGLSTTHQVVTAMLPCLKLPLVLNDVLI